MTTPYLPQRDDTDPVAIQRRLTGDHTIRLNIGEREQAVHTLNAQGHSDKRIANTIGVTKRTVLRIRQRLDIPAAPAYAKYRTTA